jgi:DNA-binding NarL/FixJ family response regulator
MIRALILSDRPLVLEGARAILEADDDFEIVGAASSRSDAVDLARSNSPDVALVDARFTAASDGELVGELRQASPLTEFVVLSVSDDAETFRRWLSHGAHGYVLDDATGEDLRLAVRRVAAGRSHIDPAVGGYLLRRPRSAERQPEESLTPREIDVLRHAAQGMTNAAIGNRLQIAPETVKTHLSRAFERLGAHDRANAVAICMRRGLF